MRRGKSREIRRILLSQPHSRELEHYALLCGRDRWWIQTPDTLIKSRSADSLKLKRSEILISNLNSIESSLPDFN